MPINILLDDDPTWVVNAQEQNMLLCYNNNHAISNSDRADEHNTHRRASNQPQQLATRVRVQRAHLEYIMLLYGLAICLCTRGFVCAFHVYPCTYT